MRVAFISDLHANIVALDAVLADIRARRVDQTVCLGDIVDLGPRPNEVVARLRELDIPCIHGNHDPLDEPTNVAHLVEIRDWSASVLTPENAAWLASLPAHLRMDLEGVDCLGVHGSPHGVSDNVTAETPHEVLQTWCSGHPFDLLVCGHTHVQLHRTFDGATIVNCGSVGQPFRRPYDGTGEPEVLVQCDYAIIEVGQGRIREVELRSVPLDLAAMRRTYPSDFPCLEQWLRSWD